MNQKPTFAPVLRTQADVESAWRHLIRPLGWSEPRLWFMFIGEDDVPIPQISEITELPAELTDEECDSAVTLLRSVVDDLGFDRVALLLCRPGRGRPNEVDQRNASRIYDAADAVHLPVEVIHLATDEDFWPLPYDAVAPSGVTA